MTLPPSILLALRAKDREVHWRRDQPAPWVNDFSELLAQHEAGWDDEHRLEARILLAKAQIDAAATLENLCSLALIANERRAWCLSQISLFAQKWPQIEKSIPQDNIIDFRMRCKLALRKLQEKMPKNRVSILALATVLYTSDGSEAALKCLESALVTSTSIEDIYWEFLARSLEEKKISESNIRRALTLPRFQGPSTPASWYQFRLRRALVFASLISLDPPTTMGKLVDMNLLQTPSNFKQVLEEVLYQATQSDETYARALYAAVASVPMFWHSPLKDVENARLSFLNELLRVAEANSSNEMKSYITRLLGAIVHKTLRFWIDDEWRGHISRRLVELSEFLPHSEQNFFTGTFSFASENYDSAAMAFQAAPAPSSKSRSTKNFIDFREVGKILESRNDEEIFSWPGLEYRDINQGSPQCDPVIITSANDRYFYRYAVEYAKKLRKISAVGHIHFHLFGDYCGSIEKIMAHIIQILPSYKITFSNERLSIDAPYYFATGRFLRLQEWAERFRAPIILTDIDSLWGQNPIQSPAEFVRDRLQNADVGLNLRRQVVLEPMLGWPFPGYRYPTLDPWHMVWAGKLFLRETESALEFARIVSRVSDMQLQKAKKTHPLENWCIDQMILCACYAYSIRHQPEIHFADLSGHPDGIGQHWLGRRKHTISENIAL
jgi:hypothetical protein